MIDFRGYLNRTGGDDRASLTELGATNINNFLTELKNIVTRSGQSLGADDGEVDTNLDQLSEAVFLAAVTARSFVDGGIADAVELTPISGASGVKIPVDYTNMDGANLTFIPAVTNTGATTIDIGQTLGTLIGIKNVLNDAGGALSPGDLTATKRAEIFYDSAADGGSGAWILQP